ncbi:MAG: ATP-binding protein [Bacteroidetes bacterium]|nr:ATP-binding protein [Bacteroidota bacterium]
MKKKDQNAGKLKIGDNWNAISIIAYSQNNPLKAIAEFVENSIDAQAKHIRIIRGKHNHQHYIKIIDDGTGIDDFSYVATHIGDSLKRKLKKQGALNIQGEFGIGLLSFWTVGEQLMLTSTGSEGSTRRMKLVKDNPGYTITQVRELFEQGTGTELHIVPLLSGIRQLSGEKIQNYLASELRDRISKSGVEIRIIDKTARKELLVEPRKFAGQLIHNLVQPLSPLGDIYCELYIHDPSPENSIGLYKHGTRVINDITTLDAFSRQPWNSDLLEGIIDVSFLQLTPGTRNGVVLDDAYENFLISMDRIAQALGVVVGEQKRAEEEKVSKNILKRISKALKEALLFLPNEEYGWLHIQESVKQKVIRIPIQGQKQGDPEYSTGEFGQEMESIVISESLGEEKRAKAFFDFPGPLFSAVISPSSAVMPVESVKTFQIRVRDRKKIPIEDGVAISWELTHNLGTLSSHTGEIVKYTSSSEPGVEELIAQVSQNDTTITCQAAVTVTKELFSQPDEKGDGNKERKGLPGYTFNHSPGELWRSTFDLERSIIIINSGHADFLFASKSNSRKLRYIAKLYAKELVMVNFPEADKEKLLERMIELQLYTEENL